MEKKVEYNCLCREVASFQVILFLDIISSYVFKKFDQKFSTVRKNFVFFICTNIDNIFSKAKRHRLIDFCRLQKKMQ